MTETALFQPNWASPPGETIAHILARRGLSLEDLAQRIDVPVATVGDLIQGVVRIDELLAEALADALGGSARFWINREHQYLADSERLRALPRNDVDAERDWLQELPVRDMTKLGWVKQGRSPSETTAALLQFFRVPDVPSWRAKYQAEMAVAAFRSTSAFPSNPAAVAAWLRWAEIQAAGIACKPWDRRRFQEALGRMRTLTRQKHPVRFLPKLRLLCAECGVALVIAPTPKGCPASGATRFLSPTKALMVLSFRYRSDDHFWFTFFHEAGHLVLHSRDALFLEDESEVSSKEEAEANEFAVQSLIPADLMPELHDLRPRTRDVIRFAVKAGIAPGIVVGQLQYMGRIGFNRLNGLKRRYSWGELWSEPSSASE